MNPNSVENPTIDTFNLKEELENYCNNLNQIYENAIK